MVSTAALWKHTWLRVSPVGNSTASMESFDHDVTASLSSSTFACSGPSISSLPRKLRSNCSTIGLATPNCCCIPPGLQDVRLWLAQHAKRVHVQLAFMYRTARRSLWYEHCPVRSERRVCSSSSFHNDTQQQCAKNRGSAPIIELRCSSQGQRHLDKLPSNITAVSIHNCRLCLPNSSVRAGGQICVRRRCASVAACAWHETYSSKGL